MVSEIARAFSARRVLLLCALLLAGRLISLPLYPLLDRTESRYAEIAREMTVSGDWVTPQVHGEPFWGKPPLSTWAQAAGIHVFGRNEFGVRFPAWIVGILTVWLVWSAGRVLGGRYVAAGGAVLFSCSPITLFMVGGVMTDPYLVLGTVLAFYGVIARVAPPPEERAGAWRSAATVALGVGIATLAKGPLGVVLGGFPFVGLLFGPSGRRAFLEWPWLRMLLIFAAIAVPWYVIAEQRTPGFLEYFIVGEHFRRYVDSTWSGDRYGFVHNEPFGMIWLHMLIGMAAWLPLLWFVLRKDRKSIRFSALSTHPGWAVTVAAAVLPLVFFTFSRNILPTYVYPALAPTAILLALGVKRTIDHSLWVRRGALLTPVITAMVCGAILVALPLVPNSVWVRQSHRDIVSHTSAPLLVYSRSLTHIYSPIFYSDGRAIGVFGFDDPKWDRVRAAPEDAVVLTRDRLMSRIPEDILARLELETDVEGFYQIWRVLPEGK